MKMSLKAIYRNRFRSFTLVSIAILVVVIVGLMLISTSRVDPHEKFNIPVITCTNEDFEDTSFIKEINKNDTIIIPEVTVLDTLSREELSALYHRYINNIQYHCKRKRRVGLIRDGGWDVCEEKKYRPVKPCVVYSFGINNDFSFDDAVIDGYGCHVYSFDPSMKIDSYQRAPLNYFSNIGIAAKNVRSEEGWQLQNLDTIKRTLGHEKTRLSMLKMDIEMYEWEVVPEIIQSGALKDVDQFFVEFHLNLLPVHPPPEDGRSTYLRAVKLLKAIHDSGFRIFWTHPNPGPLFLSKCKKIWRAFCHEVNFVRVS